MTGCLAAALLVLLIGAGCAAPGPSASAAGSRTEAPAPTTAPPAEESPAGVAADVDALLDALDGIHPDAFHGISREEFVAALDAYVEELPGLTAEESVVGLMRVTALLSRDGRDGHQFALPQPGHEGPALPMRVYEFTEGLVITAAAPPHGDKLRDTGQHTPHSTGEVPSTGRDTHPSGAPTGDNGAPDAPGEGRVHPPEDLAATPAPPASEPEVLTRAASTPSQKVVGRSFLTVAVVGLLLCLAAVAVVLIARRGDTSPPFASNSGAEESPAPSASRGGQPPTGTQPATEVAVDPSPSRAESSSTRAPEAERKTLRTALDGWVAATNSRDIGGQLVYYAPQLDAFYTRRGVSREDVRAEKQSTFGQATRVNMSVSDPSIEVGGDGLTSVMRFRKQYLIEAGGQSRSGEVLQELRWAKTSAGWRITSERDLQVLR